MVTSSLYSLFIFLPGPKCITILNSFGAISEKIELSTVQSKSDFATSFVMVLSQATDESGGTFLKTSKENN